MTPRHEDFLPLRPVELQVLAALRTRSLHGYGILQESDDGTMPGLVTVYRALQRMEERELIARDVAGADDDERRRTYRITPLGRGVLAAEARRLSALIRPALDGGGSTGGGRAR
jgi:DNA-binding PadR family transcriptional regulator